MTKEECQNLLDKVNETIKAQGRIVDARLLEKKEKLENLLKTY